MTATSPAARIVSAQRGSSRSRASDSRRSASANRPRAAPARTAVETGIACGSPAPVESTATVPVGPLRERVHAARLAAARGLALEQAVRLLELVVGRLVDRRRADVAVDARVDRAVRLAGAARDRGHERVALRAQALAPLEAVSPSGLERRAAARGRRERGQRRRRRRAGSANSCSASPGCGRLQHVVVAARARPQRAERPRRPRRARRARPPRPRARARARGCAPPRSASRAASAAGPTAGRRAHLVLAAPACGG